MNLLNQTRIISLVALSVLLTACGSGSGGMEETNLLQDVVGTPPNSGSDDLDGSGGIIEPEGTDETDGTSTPTAPLPLSGATTLDAVTASDRDIPTSRFYNSGNNSAIVSGPVVGLGTSQNNAIRKVVQFGVANPHAAIEVRQVYMLRSIGTLTASLLTVLKNNSEATHCFVKLSGLTLLNEQGDALANQLQRPEGFVDGSLGFLPNANISHVDTCIAPGELVYATLNTDSMADTDFSEVYGVSIGAIETTRDDIQSESATDVLLPISYTVDRTGFEVLVVNQSTQTLGVDTITFVVLDEQGLPLYTGQVFGDGAIAPGREQTRFINLGSFEGTASTIRITIGHVG